MILDNTALKNTINLSTNDLFNWHGLPALVVKKDKIAVFSNINGTLKIIEIPVSDIENNKAYEDAKKNHLFDCLDKKEEKLVENEKCTYFFNFYNIADFLPEDTNFST